MSQNPISPSVEIALAQEEAEHLFSLIHKGTSRARTITRARVLFPSCHRDTAIPKLARRWMCR
jgi:hypothetical protein